MLSLPKDGGSALLKPVLGGILYGPISKRLGALLHQSLDNKDYLTKHSAYARFPRGFPVANEWLRAAH